MNGLPMSSVNVIVQHPRTDRLLFVGNEIGVYVSVDEGMNWSRLKNNLPTVPVDDIVVHPRDNDLVIGTHGRGIWIMADISPLEGLTQEVLASDTHIFPVRRATSYNRYTPQGWTPSVYAAENPQVGAVIRYYLRNDIDVQEIDGASNNGVQEVRDLIENIQYAASSCKFRVYIIDEVHMLSKNAFNALLKSMCTSSRRWSMRLSLTGWRMPIYFPVLAVWGRPRPRESSPRR